MSTTPHKPEEAPALAENGDSQHLAEPSASAAHAGSITTNGESHVEPDDISVGMLVVVASMSAVVLVLVVVMLQVWFYNWKDEVVARQPGQFDEQTMPAAVAKNQLARIETYGWADSKHKNRAIPIDRAMELVIQQYADQPPAPDKENKP